MKYKIIYFDNTAQGWYDLKERFNSDSDANKFIEENRYKLSKEFNRAVKDSNVQIVEIKH